MNIRKAIDETMELAHNGANVGSICPELGYDHLCSMHKRIKADLTMSDTKLCRWLGWMQAAIVSWGQWTLEDMKAINQRNAD